MAGLGEARRRTGPARHWASPAGRRTRSQQQEVAPPVARVVRCPDDEVVASVLDLAPAEPSSARSVRRRARRRPLTASAGPVQDQCGTRHRPAPARPRASRSARRPRPTPCTPRMRGPELGVVGQPRVVHRLDEAGDEAPAQVGHVAVARVHAAAGRTGRPSRRSTRRAAHDLGPVGREPLDVLRVLVRVRERVVQLGVGQAARVVRASRGRGRRARRRRTRTARGAWGETASRSAAQPAIDQVVAELAGRVVPLDQAQELGPPRDRARPARSPES